MCRFAAYLGPPVALSSVLYDAPHALERQAYAPRQMLAGHVNVDGTGVAWWPGGDDAAEPLRYVSDRPPWSDPNLPALAPRLAGRTVLAAVRSATPGMPFGPGHVAPFVHGGLAGAHNGWLGRFRERTGRELLARLPDHLHDAYEAVNDSLVVFLTVVRHLEGDPAGDLTRALRAAVIDILEVCGEADAEATLNVVISDGDRVAVCRTARGTEGNNPVHSLQGGARWPGGTLVASEPLDDDPAWEAMPDDHVMEVSEGGVIVTRL